MTLGFNSFFTQYITCATLFSRGACSLSLDYNKTSLLYLANYSIMLQIEIHTKNLLLQRDAC